MTAAQPPLLILENVEAFLDEHERLARRSRELGDEGWTGRY